MKYSILLTISALMAFAFGCSALKPVPDSSEGITEESADYRVVTYIHGDSDYLFHDENGQSLQADENALKKVRESAEKAENGEYVIFHQQEQKKFLWLFSRKNSQLYHYKNGELINRTSYRSEPTSETPFETEAEIFRSSTAQESTDSVRNIFLYFGHEIPMYSGKGYHASRPEVNVHTEIFADGIREFIPEGDRFDLVALSTCSNGSPEMIHHLRDRTDVVLASPQNLHLSHLDTESLVLLETEPEISTRHLAEAIAESTFERLSETVQTAITLSVYEMENLPSEFINLYKEAEHYIETEHPNMNLDNIDCSKLPFFDSGYVNDSVRSYFRPARFGRDSGNTEHSGWGCKGLS